MGELWQRLGEKQKRILSWLALLTIVGLLTLLFQPAKQQATSSLVLTAGDEAFPLDQIGYWQKQLTDLVNQFVGTKGNQVFLTQERGSKLVVAYNSTIDERRNSDGSYELRTTTTPVILRNDGQRLEAPLILEEYELVVRGVVVIVDHKPQEQLKFELAQALATVLQIPMYRIEILFKQ